MRAVIDRGDPVGICLKSCLKFDGARVGFFDACRQCIRALLQGSHSSGQSAVLGGELHKSRVKALLSVQRAVECLHACVDRGDTGLDSRTAALQGLELILHIV